MYLEYEKISKIFGSFLPSIFQKKIEKWGYNQKIKQNIAYINSNKERVLKVLRKKIQKEKLIVAFYVNDSAKWKCQSLYDLMDESEYFIPYIHVTKNSTDKANSSYQSLEEIQKTHDFFNDKGLRVLYNYDIENEKFIPTKNMNPQPDIVIYQNPWYIETLQGPVRNSEFALTYYIPYFLPTSISHIEYYLRFHQYIETFYVLDDEIKVYYSENMENKGVNLKTVGHPQLDYFYLNKEKKYEDKNYVIYAPHWSIDEQTELKWGTFSWSGEFMLEYAKNHPEYKWVFKPHPNLIQALKMKCWDEEKIKKYWNAWAEIGEVCSSGDYLDMFMESKLMITDCGSFQTEYFMTQKPCIYLKSEKGFPFNTTVKTIVENYYTVKNENELKIILEKVLENDNDFMKEQRLKAFEKLKLNKNYAAKNIIDDILSLLVVNKRA